jgi:hypothetical protein
MNRSISSTSFPETHSSVAAAPPKQLVSPSPFVFQSISHVGLEDDARCTTPLTITVHLSRDAHGDNEDNGTSATRVAVVTPPAERKSKITRRTPMSRRKTQREGGSIAMIPTDKDVLAERGSASNNHKGHKFYWRLIVELRTEYISLGKRGNKQKKKELAWNVANRVFENGGRFLMRADKDSPWYEMLDDAYIDKIQNALREEKNIAESAREYAKNNFPEVYGKFIALQQAKKDRFEGRESKKAVPRKRCKRKPAVAAAVPLKGLVQPDGRRKHITAESSVVTGKVLRRSRRRHFSTKHQPVNFFKPVPVPFKFPSPKCEDGSRMVQGKGSSDVPPPWLERNRSVHRDAAAADACSSSSIDVLADDVNMTSRVGEGADLSSSDVHQQEEMAALVSHIPLLDFHSGSLIDQDIAIAKPPLEDRDITTLGMMASPSALDPHNLDYLHSWIPNGVVCSFFDGESSCLTSLETMTDFACSTEAVAAILSPFHNNDARNRDTRPSVPIRHVSMEAFGERYDDVPPLCRRGDSQSGPQSAFFAWDLDLDN